MYKDNLQYYFLHSRGWKWEMKSYFLDYEKTVQVVKTTCFTQYQFSYLNPKGVDSSCKIDGFLATYKS